MDLSHLSPCFSRLRRRKQGSLWWNTCSQTLSFQRNAHLRVWADMRYSTPYNWQFQWPWSTLFNHVGVYLQCRSNVKQVAGVARIQVWSCINDHFRYRTWRYQIYFRYRTAFAECSTWVRMSRASAWCARLVRRCGGCRPEPVYRPVCNTKKTSASNNTDDKASHLSQIFQWGELARNQGPRSQKRMIPLPWAKGEGRRFSVGKNADQTRAACMCPIKFLQQYTHTPQESKINRTRHIFFGPCPCASLAHNLACPVPTCQNRCQPPSAPCWRKACWLDLSMFSSQLKFGTGERGCGVAAVRRLYNHIIFKMVLGKTCSGPKIVKLRNKEPTLSTTGWKLPIGGCKCFAWSQVGFKVVGPKTGSGYMPAEQHCYLSHATKQMQ